MPIAKRLRDWLHERRIPNTELIEKLGLSSGGVSSIVTGRSKMSIDTLVKLLTAYPDLCPRWILLGEPGRQTSVCANTEGLIEKAEVEERIRMLEDLVETKSQLIEALQEKLKVCNYTIKRYQDIGNT